MVLVRFSVVSLAPPGVVLAVSGSCASLGKWSCDAAVPLTGRLGATRRSTEPDFHSVELEIPEAESEQVEYKFLELGDIKWEEGPDGKNRILKVEEKDVIHRDDGKILLLPVERWEPHWSEKKITSYFYKGVTEGTEGTEGPAISVTQVLHQLFVGSCPRRRSHIEDLKKRGITTVFNFQTEDDCKTNCIPDIGMDKNPLAVGKIYEAEGMEYIWMPTWDMDTAGRANMLPQASFLLAQLLRKGHKVYCHCNAGVGRSTAAVCGYLTFALGLSVREMQHVMVSSRPVTVFNLGAIEEARPHYKARYEVDAEMQPKADLRCREEALALLKPF